MVALCDIRSIHNVGSIFRTADGAGVSKIFLCGYTPAPADRLGVLRSQFAKTALGAEKTVAHEKAPAAAQLVKKLRDQNYYIVAVEQTPDSVDYKKAGAMLRKKKNICFLFGNEIKGLSPSICRAADLRIDLPMRGAKESLNVAVCAGIILYEACRQGERFSKSR